MAYRDEWCGDVQENKVGSRVRVAGWVQRRRDHGGLIFVDLRDRTGILQLVFEAENAAAVHEHAQQLRGEYVLSALGTVVARAEERVNPNLSTGMVELVVEELEILAAAETPPFFPEDDVEVDETLRLKYRYIDLRRPRMFRNLELRHRVVQKARRYLGDLGFLEVETPILTKSTPEGARDFLVPCRLQPGEFYALPQSPQLFKQLLMIAGFERYYQIARAFRDEDLRADRQPEHTQIDIEMSFVDEEDIQRVVEGLFAGMFQEALGVELTLPFPRLPTPTRWLATAATSRTFAWAWKWWMSPTSPERWTSRSSPMPWLPVAWCEASRALVEPASRARTWTIWRPRPVRWLERAASRVARRGGSAHSTAEVPDIGAAGLPGRAAGWRDRRPVALRRRSQKGRRAQHGGRTARTGRAPRREARRLGVLVDPGLSHVRV